MLSNERGRVLLVARSEVGGEIRWRSTKCVQRRNISGYRSDYATCLPLGNCDEFRRSQRRKDPSIAGCRKRCGRIAPPDAQAILRRRRHQPRRPPLAKIRPGSPAPAMGPGTGTGTASSSGEFAPENAAILARPNQVRSDPSGVNLAERDAPEEKFGGSKPIRRRGPTRQ
jgi:hypothetical protein